MLNNESINPLNAILENSNKFDKKKPLMIVYFQKAIVFKKQRKYKEAIENFILAERNNRIRDPNYSNIIKLNIAIIKLNYLGEVKEGLQMLKKCLIFYKKKDAIIPQYSNTYHEIIFEISDAYKLLYKNDSATYYNRLGYNECLKKNDEKMKYLFIYNEGTNQVCKKRYKPAIDSLNKAFPKLLKSKDYNIIVSSFYYLGKAYEGLKSVDKALEYYIKVDSIYFSKQSLHPEFIDAYPFIIEYFKNKGDNINQLHYITRYMLLDSLRQNDYKVLNKLIHRKYDIPLVVKEKENIILSLDRKKAYWIKLAFTLFIFTLVFSIICFYQWNQNKIYQKRFAKLFVNNTSLDNSVEKHKFKIPQDNDQIRKIDISEELINQVLKKLQEFELKKGYLKSSITIQMLSDHFDTNSKYLSRIVNEYKNKNHLLITLMT